MVEVMVVLVLYLLSFFISVKKFMLGFLINLKNRFLKGICVWYFININGYELMIVWDIKGIVYI